MVVPPDLVRRILYDGEGSFDEGHRLAAALGYVAHIVDRLALYLDVPLRWVQMYRSGWGREEVWGGVGGEGREWAALGYVAHIVDRVAVYLEVPLR